MKEDPVKTGYWKGLKRAVPLSSGELLRDIYIYFRADMKEIGGIFQVSVALINS